MVVVFLVLTIEGYESLMFSHYLITFKIKADEM
jgi:hypothetical protein